MAFYQFTQQQKIPAGLGEVWKFVSSPMNLREITPPDLGFLVTSVSGSGTMYPGMIITYKVRPFLGIPVKWMTEITHVDENKFFVDEQRIGPYRFWHHQHLFEPIAGGVLMRDIVTYSPPYGWLGSLANSLLISGRLKSIFAFREAAVERRFGKWTGATVKMMRKE